MIRILYPENRVVTPEQVQRWASDDLYNERGIERPWQEIPLTEAVEILQDTGSVTFHKSVREGWTEVQS